MNFDNAQLFGIASLIVLALLGAYLVLLQIREHFYEKPDPKLTYMTKSDFEKYTHTLQVHISELAKVSHENSQQIAALAAQTHIILQRISELTTKIDRIQETSNASAPARSARRLATR